MKKIIKYYLIAVISILFVIIVFCNIKLDKKNSVKITFNEYYENKLMLYQEENNRFDDYEVDVAFLGDSLTDLCDLSVYYPEYVTVNRGISGDTSFGLENRLQVSAYDLKPKVVVMLIGANNFDTMLENYEKILLGFKENIPNTKVILLSLTSMSKSWGKNNDIAMNNNLVIKELAKKYQYEYVDLFYLLMNPRTNEIYDEYTIDGGHLTSMGYDVVSAEVKLAINKLLGYE